MMTRPLAFAVAAILISGWLQLIYGQTPVIINPTVTQTVVQPPGTFLVVTRLQGTAATVIPNGGVPPTGGCRNGSIYLQRISGTAAVIWGCSQSVWVRLQAMLNPHTDQSTATDGQTQATISQALYLPTSLQVFRNGLLQAPAADYGVSGTTVTFIIPLTARDNISLAYLAP